MALVLVTTAYDATDRAAVYSTTVRSKPERSPARYVLPFACPLHALRLVDSVDQLALDRGFVAEGFSRTAGINHMYYIRRILAAVLQIGHTFLVTILSRFSEKRTFSTPRAVYNRYLKIENSSFAHHFPVDEVTDLALSISNKHPLVYYSRVYSMNGSLASREKET
jgi:hypothetical protein